MLVIFFRAMRGEWISVKKLADEFEVSTKSISRDINQIKIFLSDNRELVGYTELDYDFSKKAYYLKLDEFLTNKELFSIIEILIGSRALSNTDTLTIINKVKRFSTPHERKQLEEITRKEMFRFNEVKHDCENVQDNLWSLAKQIHEKKEISITYYKMNRDLVEHRIRPMSLLFTDYYFYLIAFKVEDETRQPHFFRVDRIVHITEHRSLTIESNDEFDEGKLREQCPFMFPGKLRKIRFEFTGPSVQAILDRLPTAKIIERPSPCKYLIEAEVYGDGIKIYLLSQGSWVKVVHPQEFADEMKAEAERMLAQYQ